MFIDPIKAELGAAKAQKDVAAAATAIATVNDKVSALLVQAREAQARNDMTTGRRLMVDARNLARDMVLTRAKYHKAVEVASMVGAIEELKRRMAQETDPAKRAVLDRGATNFAAALKKFGTMRVKVKLPSRTVSGSSFGYRNTSKLNGLGDLDGFVDDIGGFFKDAGSLIKNNAGTIGAVAGTAIGTYLGGPAGAQMGLALGGTVGSLLQGKKKQVSQQAPAPGAPQVPYGGAYDAATANAAAAGVPTGYGLPQQNFGVPAQLPGGVPLNPYANGMAAQTGGAQLFKDPTQQLAQQPTPLMSGGMKTALYVGGGVAALALVGGVAYVALK